MDVTRLCKSDMMAAKRSVKLAYFLADLQSRATFVQPF
jgi:hypothetical protein